MDKEELNKKLKEFDKDFVSVHLGDFEVIKMIHKRIIGYSKSGMSLEKIYEGFKAKEIIKNISLSVFKKEVRKLKNVQKNSSNSSLVRVKKVAEEVPLSLQEEDIYEDEIASFVKGFFIENYQLEWSKENATQERLEFLVCNLDDKYSNTKLYASIFKMLDRLNVIKK